MPCRKHRKPPTAAPNPRRNKITTATLGSPPSRRHQSASRRRSSLPRRRSSLPRQTTGRRLLDLFNPGDLLCGEVEDEHPVHQKGDPDSIMRGGASPGAVLTEPSRRRINPSSEVNTGSSEYLNHKRSTAWIAEHTAAFSLTLRAGIVGRDGGFQTEKRESGKAAL